MSEHAEQAQLVEYLNRLNVPSFAVPNGAQLGGKNRFAMLRKLKNEGLRTGAPDLVLIRLADGLPVAIEMKRPGGGRVSPVQRETHQLMRDEGWVVVVAYGFQDARVQLEDLGVIPRAA